MYVMFMNNVYGSVYIVFDNVEKKSNTADNVIIYQ